MPSCVDEFPMFDGDFPMFEELHETHEVFNKKNDLYA
jgi:hypothetical protein